jgi:hypothetical protein
MEVDMRADRERTLQEGLVAGVIGFLVVAVLSAIVNLLEGRSPFIRRPSWAQPCFTA